MTHLAVCSRCSMGTPVTVDDFLEVLSTWVVKFEAGQMKTLICDACKTDTEHIGAMVNGAMLETPR